MTSSKFHVIIAGGGIGGLCLAQGLKKSGVSVSVYERDKSAASRAQGYRININETGSHALKECLPDHLYGEFLSTCGEPSNSYHIYTHAMKKLLTVENNNKYESDIKPVHRKTLRQVLLTDMTDILHFNKKFVHYERTHDGTVKVFFEDGTHAAGDVLIAADGVNSKVRKQFLPNASRIDTGILSLVGKIPLNTETEKLVNEDTISMIAPKGMQMSVTIQKFKQSSNEDYIMWGIFARKDKFNKNITAMNTGELYETVLSMVRDWHPDIRELLTYNDSDSIKLIPIHSSERIDHWETTNITLLGDAIHSMTPMMGMGANMALKDAEILCDVLTRVQKREYSLHEGLSRYETQMLDYSFEAVNLSLQAAKEATTDRLISGIFMKMFFRSLNVLPYFKYKLFRF